MGDTTKQIRPVSKAPPKKAPEKAPKEAKPNFISSAIGELKKVVWPTRQETIKLTTMVLVVSAVMGVILGLFDFGFSKLIDLLVK